MKIKSIKEAKKLGGQKVFLRVDFNVPIENGEIKDSSKIMVALPTIRFLLRYNCPIIIATHLGEPRGKKKHDLSTEPLAAFLEKTIGPRYCQVKFVNACVGAKVEKMAKKLTKGEILFLENLRFNKGEETNDKDFAKKLASLADIYVNEAFSVCHRNHASVNAIRKYLPAYAGIFLEKEITSLNKIKNPDKPLVALMGGAKIETKIKLIKDFSKKAGNVLIGGALANNFFKAQGLNIGDSLFDNKSFTVAKKFLKNKKIILPIDLIVAVDGKKEKPAIKLINEIGDKDVILDIGPETIKKFAEILKNAKTIIWNGPMGMFEERAYSHGTLALAQVIATRSRGKVFGVAGGGETIEALKLTKMADWMDWVSTGGGAMLSYLGGEKMPGLQ